MNQLRKSLKWTWMTHFRHFIQKKRIGKLGKGVFIEENVKLMRYPKNISIGDDVVLKEGARLCACNANATISVGERTTIGYHNFYFASERITIGSDCLIAPFVYIVDSNHKALLGTKINEQPNETAPISIGNDVWIASNVTILKGVTIADGSILAANSVINKSTEPNGIYGGTPAVKIGERNAE